MNMAKWLIKQGADINVVDANGDTPLMNAIKRPYYQTGSYIRHLLNAGATFDANWWAAQKLLTPDMLSIEQRGQLDKAYDYTEEDRPGD